MTRTWASGTRMRRLVSSAVLGAALLAVTVPTATPAQARASASPRLDARAFERPDPGADPAILWFWHDAAMTPTRVRDQLDELAAKGFRRIMLFPLASTPPWYTEAWFDLLGTVFDEARANGQRIYLFNDNYVPSGRGAGFVVGGGKLGDQVFEPRPDLRPQQLFRTPVDVQGEQTVDVAGAWPGVGSPPAQLSIDDGALYAQAGENVVMNVGAEWGDYTLEFDVKPRPVGEGAYAQAGWLARAEDARNGYLFFLSTYPYLGAGSYLVRAALADGQIVAFQPVKLPSGIDTAAFTHVKQQFDGDHIVTEVDGTVVDDVRDGRYARGTFGLRQQGAEYAWYDNLTVTAPDGRRLFAADFADAGDLAAFAPRLPADRVVAVSALPLGADGPALDRAVDLTDAFRDERTWDAPPGGWQLQYFTRDYLDSLGGGGGYFDLMNDEAVDRFIRATYGEIVRRYPNAVGSVLAGFWDDEAVTPAGYGYVPWSDSLPAALTNQGTTVGKALPALFADLGAPGRRARGAFWHAANDRWAAAWYRRQARWLGERGLELISNPLGDHAGPSDSQAGGDLLKNNQWAQIPGSDAIFGQVLPGSRTLIPRYSSSSASQNGRRLALHEILGGYGHYVDTELLKYVDGAMSVRGSTLTLLHAYWANPANDPYPPSFDSSNTWWPHLGGYLDWSARVAELGHARTAPRTALLVPQRAAEAAYRTPDVGVVDEAFRRIAFALEDQQVDFDFLSEGNLDGDPAMREQARVDGGRLDLGPQRYRYVVLPGVRTMSLTTARALRRLVDSGGTVVATERLPVEEPRGRGAALRAELSELFGTDPADPEATRMHHGRGTAVFAPTVAAAAGALDGTDACAVRLRVHGEGDPRLVRALRRQARDASVTILFNEGERTLDLDATVRGVAVPEIWDPETGAHAPSPRFATTSEATTVRLRLAPYQMLAIVLRRDGPRPDKVPHVTATDADVLSVSGRGGRALDAEVAVDAAGAYPVEATLQGRTYRGTATVTSMSGAVELGGPWGFRFDRDDAEELQRPLGSWTSLEQAFSGPAEYWRSFELPAAELGADRRWVLDLGVVHDIAELRVNGEPVSTLLWRPYRADVTRLLRPGANTVTVRVTNTPANRNGDPRPSGLLGPVVLHPRAVVPVRLERVKPRGV